MKKISVFLALIILTVSTVYSAEYKTDIDFSKKPENFTEQISDDGHFVKYDAENADIYALNTDGSGGQSGVIELDEALSGVIDISFDFTAAENHARLKMFFANENGEQIHMHQIYKSRAGVYLTNSTVSAIDSTAKKGTVGEKMYVKMKIDTDSKTARYSFGLENDNEIVWSTQKDSVATEGLTEQLNLKKIILKNEYSKCDIRLDNFSICGNTENQEDNEDEEDNEEEVNISYPEEEDSEYIVVYTNDFTDESTVTGTSLDEGHYAVLDKEKNAGALKNTDGTGGQKLSLPLLKEYQKDGTRVAFTFYAQNTHQRLKSQYYNRSGEIVHQNNILLRNGMAVICNNVASMVDSSLPQYPAETAVRLEIEFDFTNRLVSYRTYEVSNGKWVYGNWITDKPAYAASENVPMELYEIGFLNEYGVCDMYIDDVRISIPKVKPEARNVRIEGMKADYPITKDILAGKFDYFEENGVEKGECELSWIISDNNGFTGESSIVSGDTLALEGLEGKYIKFTVVPVSAAGERGKAYETEPIGPVVLVEDTMTPPEAKELSIKGEVSVGATIEADYKYYDADFDDEGATEIIWYLIKDDKEEPVKTGSKEDLTLLIEEEYAGGRIKLTVTPKSKNENEEAGEKAETVTDEVAESVAYKDYIALTLTPGAGSDIAERIYLPTKGENGSDIVWQSSKPDSIATDGSVKRGTRDEEVTLTATIALNGIEYKKEFTYTVLKKKTSGGGSSGGGGGSSYSGGGYSVPSVGNEKEETKAPTAPGFNDLAGFEWAEKEINELYNKGIISGDGNGNFSPERYVTRAEFVKMVVDFFKIEGTRDITFSDVERDDWYYESVKKAVASGIVSGISASYFGADERISRQDMAVIISRIKGFAASGSQEAFSDDAMISDYARDAVYAMREKGIINGRDTGEFDPRGSATRAEAAKIICVSGN